MSLSGKVAVVTGGGAGPGRSIALHYARAGARVVVSDINDEKGEETVELDETSRAALDTLHPVGRMGEPDEIGAVVAAVSASSWSFVNGAYLPVDGGYLSR